MSKKNDGIGVVIIFFLMGIALILYEIFSSKFDIIILSFGIFFTGIGLYFIKNSLSKIETVELKLVNYDEKYLYFKSENGKGYIYLRKDDDKIDLFLNKCYTLTVKGNKIISLGKMSNYSFSDTKESFWRTFYFNGKKYEYIIILPILYFVEFVFICTMLLQSNYVLLIPIVAGLGPLVYDLKCKINNKKIYRKEDK